MSDFHEAVRQDMLEETADELQHVERGGAVEVGAVLSIFEGDGTVFELDDAVVRDGDLCFDGLSTGKT